MVKIKIRILLLPIIFIGFGSNASPIIFSGVSTMNTNNRLGFDFFHQVACSTIASYSGCYDNFYIYGGGPLTVLETAGNSGYAAKIGQVNLDSMKTAPADSVFALSPLWIDQIPFDSLPYRVGCSYWIKTSPDNIEGGQILFAKIRILSFPIMDSIKPETEMTFLYAVTPSGGRSCIPLVSIPFTCRIIQPEFSLPELRLAVQRRRFQVPVNWYSRLPGTSLFCRKSLKARAAISRFSA